MFYESTKSGFKGIIMITVYPDGHLQTVQEEQVPDMSTVDLSSLDKETIHKLISLLMKVQANLLLLSLVITVYLTCSTCFFLAI